MRAVPQLLRGIACERGSGAQCPLSPEDRRREKDSPYRSVASHGDRMILCRGWYDCFFHSHPISPEAGLSASRHCSSRSRNCTASRDTVLLAPAFPIRAGGSGSPLLSEFRSARPVKANGTKAPSPIVVNKKPADLDGESAGFKENRAEQCSFGLGEDVANKSPAFNSFLAENAPDREVGKKPIP
jgi:hypothetical protein